MRLNANISSDSRLRYETIFLEWDNSYGNKKRHFPVYNNSYYRWNDYRFLVSHNDTLSCEALKETWGKGYYLIMRLPKQGWLKQVTQKLKALFKICIICQTASLGLPADTRAVLSPSHYLCRRNLSRRFIHHWSNTDKIYLRRKIHQKYSLSKVWVVSELIYSSLYQQYQVCPPEPVLLMMSR